jgi:hypothetical protein
MAGPLRRVGADARIDGVFVGDPWFGQHDWSPMSACGIAESGVDRGLDSGVEVEARIGSYARSSQRRIDPSNGRSPVV